MKETRIRPEYAGAARRAAPRRARAGGRGRGPPEGRGARPGSDRGLVLVELASEPVELVLLAAGELAEGADLRVHVAGDALDDRLGEAGARRPALLPARAGPPD